MEILRDRLGVPHCYAGSSAEAFRSQGFVHAADRLWQMEYDRRRARGRLSELIGRRGVAVDVFYRRMDLTTFVERDLAALAPSTRSMLDAYAAGVNDAIGQLAAPRELEVVGLSDLEPWAPADSLLVYRVRHLMMGSARTKLWRAVVAGRLGADVARTIVAGFGEEHLACVPPAAPFIDDAGGGTADVDGGSNNWVVAGRRTWSGLPLLAGDPHRELESPNVYVQGHVACAEWDVLGIGMPGVPGFPHFGHNDRVAWSITHAMADDQDLFVMGDLSGFDRRSEMITVRGDEPVEVDVVHTDRGPVIGEDLALCWTATVEVNLGFDAIVPMLQSASVDELFDTMRPWVEPANSLLGADVHGHIGYLTRGRLPRRSRSESAWFPVPGDDESYAWLGWVAFEDLPRCHDPEEGFLFSANNRIAASPPAPYIGMDAAAPWRARRIVDHLEALSDATVDDMQRVHRDVVSLPARRVLARLGGWPPTDGWDATMSADSTAAAAYSVLRRELLLLIFERTGLDSVREEGRNRLLPGVVPESVMWRAVEQHLAAGDTMLLGGGTWDEVLAEAKARAESVWLGETWGQLHRTSQRHVLGPLDPLLDPTAFVGLAGDLDSVFATGYTPTVGFDVKTGSVARYAFDLADWDRSGWVVPLGAAGLAADPHGTDQQAAWAQGRLLPAPYTRAAVEASAAVASESPAAGDDPHESQNLGA